MKAKLYDYRKNETREIDTKFLSLLQWVRVNFAGWGFYEIKHVGKNSYEITDKFSKESVYKIN